MTQFLIRLFIRQPDHAQDPKVRAAYGNLACWVGVACNLLLCLGKLTVGTLFGSIAIMADALNNLSDASSNVVSLVGFKLAGKAPDAEHPFGHARYEYLAGLVVSVTILGIGFSLLKESVVKVLHPTPVMFSWLTVAVLVGIHPRQAVDERLQPHHRAHHRLRDPHCHCCGQPQRCAEHRRGAHCRGAVPRDRLGRAGWPDGCRRGGVHPDLRLGPCDGYAQPAAGRKPQRGSGGPHRAEGALLSRRAGNARFDGARLRPGTPVRLPACGTACRAGPAGGTRPDRQH